MWLNMNNFPSLKHHCTGITACRRLLPGQSLQQCQVKYYKRSFPTFHMWLLCSWVLWAYFIHQNWFCSSLLEQQGFEYIVLYYITMESELNCSIPHNGWANSNMVMTMYVWSQKNKSIGSKADRRVNGGVSSLTQSCSQMPGHLHHNK